MVLTPSGITSSEAFGTPELENMLQILVTAGITPQQAIGLATIIGGDRLLIPVHARQSWNSVSQYLRSVGFKGSNNDVIVSWFRGEGIVEGPCNDLWIRYLNANGITETNLGDAYAKWRQ